MNDKAQLLRTLQDEFDRWEALLAGLSEAQITARQLPGGLSVKDVMAHLWAWQQRSIARLEAALHGGEPEFPRWVEGLDPDAHENTEPVNAWIHDTNRDRPWPEVYRSWLEGFLRFMALGEAIAEQELFEVGRFPWLGEYPLAFILEASYRHHHEEHYEPLRAWLAQQGWGGKNHE